MGLFDDIFGVDEDKLKAQYHKAYHESNGKAVNPREHRALDASLRQYAKENNCSYTEALIKAKKL